MPSLQERVRNGELTRKTEAVYRYVWPNGKWIVKKVKYGYYMWDGDRVGKDFLILSRYRYEWVPEMFDAYRPVIYRLPLLREPIRRGEGVYLTEGEGDADTGAEYGMVTTTTYSDMKPCHAEWLRGCDRVHIVMDRDPAGFLIGARRAAVLDAAGLKYRFLLPADPYPKTDLSEHLNEGHGVDELEEASPAVVAREAEAAEEALKAGAVGSWFGSAEYLQAQEDTKGSPWFRKTGAVSAVGTLAERLASVGLSREDAARIARSWS